MTVIELRNKRAQKLAAARAFLESNRTPDGFLSQENDAAYTAMESDIANLGKEISRMERLEAMDAELSRPLTSPLTEKPAEVAKADEKTGRASDEYSAAFWNQTRRKDSVTPEMKNALQEGVDSEGGYLVPDEFEHTLVQALEQENIVREHAHVFTTSSGNHKIPVVTSKGTASWIDEEGAIPESDDVFGQQMIGAHKVGTLIKVSEELLNDSAFDLEGYFASEFARRIGNKEEDAFFNGDGAGKPLGILAATGGAQVGVTAASATAVTADEITSDTIARQALERAVNAENESSETSSAVANISRELSRLSLLTQGKIDDAYVEDGFLYMTSDGDVVVGSLGPFSGGEGSGGGGGSSGNNAKLTLANKSGFLSRKIADGDSLPVTINWTSLEDDIPTGNGAMKITVGGAVKAVTDIAQGDVTIDLAPFLSVGSSSVKVNVSDVYGNSRTLNFSITVVLLTLTSSFDDAVAYTGPVSFPYVPTGNISKTVHFLLDGGEIGTAVTSVSGRQQSFTIPQQRHGAHTFSCWFEAEINGASVCSNTLYYELICVEPMNLAPIVTCSLTEFTVRQYATLHIGYSVYNPASMNAEVTVKKNGALLSTQTVGRGRQDFSCRMDEAGDFTFEISSGGVSRSVSITVTPSDIEAHAETDALKLCLKSEGRSNAEETRAEWVSGEIAAELTGFNFKSDGWQPDDEGITALRVSGDAWVHIPYKIFESDFRTTGKTIELEFATRQVMDYDAVILSCLSGGRGLLVTAQKAQLTSEQSEIAMQFKENEHVRVSFVVEKRSENRLICCYINGVMSGAVQYPAGDDFSQREPADISIGSSDCTVDIYAIRVYDNDLTRGQILDNMIADTQNIDTLLSRYQRNRVYDAYGSIVKEQLPGDLPYLILECDELPQYKGDKKTVSGSFTDPIHTERSFTFTGAQFDVQGTSSQYYERKNYKGKFKGGFVMANGSTAEKYSIRENSIPVSTFCFKADVASSEGANNVELARLYNDACPYKTPAERQDDRVRQGIDGFPIVIFWHNTATNETVFMGKYNFNNDKSTEEVFGFQPGDESWEVRNNTSDRVIYKSADYSGDDWQGDFEARFPDEEPPYSDPAQLREFAEWLVSTDTEKATNSALPSPVTFGENTYDRDTAVYRLAKFKAEAGDYMELDSAMFYYLFTELFLMVDSRAKNMFPSFMGGDVAE